MNLETVTGMNEELYRVVLLIIEFILLTVGCLSVLFILMCLHSAACGHFVERRKTNRRQPALTLKPMGSSQYVLTEKDDSFDDTWACKMKYWKSVNT